MSKIWRLLTGRGSTASYVVLTIIFTIVPEDCFKFELLTNNITESKNIIITKLIVCVVVWGFVNIAYLIRLRLRKKVSISDNNFCVQVEYGDLFEVKKGRVIVDFDECFTTKVGNAPGDIKPKSICGQYLLDHPIEDFQALIDIVGLKPLEDKSKYEGRIRYTPGNIVPRGNFLLMAFAKLDENGLGYLTYSEYIDCLNKLWQQIDLYHGTSDVYMPILGSNIVRFEKNLTQQELLNIIIMSYRISPKRLSKPYVLHVICKKREGFSLNDVYGAE